MPRNPDGSWSYEWMDGDGLSTSAIDARQALVIGAVRRMFNPAIAGGFADSTRGQIRQVLDDERFQMAVAAPDETYELWHLCFDNRQQIFEILHGVRDKSPADFMALVRQEQRPGHSSEAPTEPENYS